MFLLWIQVRVMIFVVTLLHINNTITLKHFLISLKPRKNYVNYLFPDFVFARTSNCQSKHC